MKMTSEKPLEEEDIDVTLVRNKTMSATGKEGAADDVVGREYKKVIRLKRCEYLFWRDRHYHPFCREMTPCRNARASVARLGLL